jgi:virulence-associated protein VagC
MGYSPQPLWVKQRRVFLRQQGVSRIAAPLKGSLKKLSILDADASRPAALQNRRNIQIFLRFSPCRQGASTPKITYLFFLEP